LDTKADGPVLKVGVFSLFYGVVVVVDDPVQVHGQHPRNLLELLEVEEFATILPSLNISR